NRSTWDDSKCNQQFPLDRYIRCFACQRCQMVRYPLQPICKTFFGNPESEPEMIRHSETISRGKQSSSFSDSATELSRIASALQPREADHPAVRTHPTELASPL